MTCWLAFPAALKSPSTSTAIIMVFNTALCFALAAGTLLLPDSHPRLARWGRAIVGGALILFASAVLSQDLTGISLHLDQWLARVSVSDFNPHPGRISPPASVCFILCGLVFILLNRPPQRAVGFIIQLCLIFIMAIALIGLMGSFIRLELIYDWYKYGRMALLTGIGILMLCTALWLHWHHQSAQHDRTRMREDRRINSTGIIIISFVALSAGMSGFGILANQIEHTLELSLEESRNNHIELVKNELELSLSGAFPITTRLLLNRYLAIFDTHPDMPDAREIIKQDAQSFLGNSFSAVAIYSRSGQAITEVGHFTPLADLTVPLTLRIPSVKAELLWKNGAFIHIAMDIVVNGEKIGSALVERPLPYISKLLTQKDFLGETAETRVCLAVSERDMRCLPSNHHREVFPVEPRVRMQDITSMDFALRGLTGIRIFQDYRNHQAVSAYGPVGDYGLGMVAKIDTAEFYSPIRERLYYAIALILLLCGLGIFIQNLQLVPLVKRLVESEKRVKNVNRFQQTLLDSSNFTIIACDARGIIQVFNKSAERMLGYKAEEMIGKMTPGIFHDPALIKKRAEELSLELGREIKPGFETFIAKPDMEGSEEHEWVYIRKDGTRYPVLLSVSCLRNEAGEINGSLAIGVDITERKRLEKVKSEFISTVSHELRTPLTSIRGSLGLMRSGLVGELAPKAKEMAEIAYNNAERLILLINDILDIDKIESGEMRMELEEHDLETLVNQSVEANYAYGEKFGVYFAIKPMIPPALIKVDANRFIQVLSNLLSNAAKFSKQGDEVRILITRQSNKIRVAVADSGLGIPPEFQSRIFSKFAQADSSSSRQKGGTGLGLNISKQIVEHMNGRIGFTSEMGHGSTFWIEFPEAVRIASQELQDAIDYLHAQNISFLPHILHAEDDRDFCRIIAHSLQERAIVHVASNVADAVELLASNVYDLLILDLELPDGSGLKLLEQLRASGRDTRVMILSASEVDGKTRGKVDIALVKSRVSELRIVEHILSLIRGK